MNAEAAGRPETQCLGFAGNSNWHEACISALGQPCLIEAKLTSHLTISYSAATAAGGATSTTAGSSTAPAGTTANSAANFLEALIDEILSGGNPAAKSPSSSTSDAATAAQPVGSAASPQTTPVPFGDAVDATAAPAGTTTPQPQAKALLAKLARELKALEDQLKSGDKPDPSLLQQLGQTADAIAGLMAQPAQAAAATPAASGSTDDTSAMIGAVSGATPATATPPAATASLSGTPAPANDQAAQFLASLGLPLDQQQPTSSPVTSGGDETFTAPSEPASSPPLPGIAALASQLADATAAVQAVSPTIAQKLQNLSQKLDAAEIDPQSLGALTTTSDSSGKSLDSLVQSLLAARPASVAKPATPSVQLASSTRLPVPDALVKVTSPTQTNASSTKSQPAQPTPDPGAAAQVTPSPNQPPAPSSATASTSSVVSKPEAALVADAVAKADPAKTDATDPNSQTPDAASAAAAPAIQATPRIIPAAYQVASAATANMGQVAFEMAKQIQDGQSRFSIRLDPPELGRVDVKMHVDASGNVNAHLTVERTETLDMFQRDKGSLERALSQAGVDTGKTNLQFSLKQNPFAGTMNGGQQSSGGNRSGVRFSASADDDADDAISAVPQITLYRGVASAGGVNLFA